MNARWVRHYTLSAEDLTVIDRRRGAPNRLGFAVMLCYLRFLGRTLRQDEQPPMAMLTFIAEQLKIEATRFGDYAERDKTRREHLAEIQAVVGYRILSRAIYRDLSAWLLPAALATEKGSALAASLLDELRSRRVIGHRWQSLNGSAAKFAVEPLGNCGASSPMD